MPLNFLRRLVVSDAALDHGGKAITAASNKRWTDCGRATRDAVVGDLKERFTTLPGLFGTAKTVATFAAGDFGISTIIEHVTDRS